MDDKVIIDDISIIQGGIFGIDVCFDFFYKNKKCNLKEFSLAILTASYIDSHAKDFGILNVPKTDSKKVFLELCEVFSKYYKTPFFEYIKQDLENIKNKNEYMNKIVQTAVYLSYVKEEYKRLNIETRELTEITPKITKKEIKNNDVICQNVITALNKYLLNN